MDFYGIVSENGVENITPSILTDFEGFKPDPKKLSLYAMEVFSNRDKDMVLYLADLSLDDFEKINKMIESGNKRDALEVLDKNSKSLSIMDSENAEKKWKNLTSK
jgi:hypothetical protein